MTVSKVLFPGIVLAIFFMLGITSFLGSPQPGSAHGDRFAAYSPQKVRPDGCTISESYPQSIQQWCVIIERSAREYNVDANLISAVMLQESGGQPEAYSKSGAVGLMQVMPRDGKAAHFMCKNGPCFSDRPTTDALFDPEFNVMYGASMLSELMNLKDGSVRDALKSYGPMDVGYYYADLVINIWNTHR